MSKQDCRGFEARLGAYAEGALDEAAGEQVASHVESCAGCEAALDRIEAGGSWLAAMRGERVLAGFDDGDIAVARRRAMAQIRLESPVRPSRVAGFGFSWGVAGLFAVLALVFVLAPQPRPVASVATAAVAEDMNLVTVAGRDGIELRWKGGDSSYLVIKSRRGAGDEGEVTTVCGTTWTDRSQESGAAFYRVVPLREHCQTGEKHG